MRRWTCSLFGLLMALGCVSPDQERTLSYAQDGMHLYERGSYREARDTFLAALAIRPEDPNLLFNVGECYDQLDDSREAEHHYRTCLQFAPDHAGAHHALSALLLRTNRQDQAMRETREWLTRSPQCSAAYAEEGWLLHQAGDLPRAQSRLQQALQINPNDSFALIELGRIYETLQRPDRAIALYERVLERDPKQATIAERINILKRQGAGQPLPDGA